jgi:uncharacterized protein
MRGQGCYPVRRVVRAGLLAAIAAFSLAGAAQADPPPPGSTWHETYIQEPDGTSPHADVLRPSDLPADAKTPVILSIGSLRAARQNTAHE